MAHVILPAIRAGRVVFTNIPLVLEHVFEVDPLAKVMQFTSADVTGPEWWNEHVPAGATCVIDECWEWFPSGAKISGVDPNILDFFKMHRHRVGLDGKTTEIILVTQDLGDISAWLRNLVDKTYYSEKLDVVGADKKYRVDVYKGAVTGDRPPKRKRINQIFGSYQEKIYACYKSATRSQDVGDEKSTDRRATVWARSSMRYGAPAMVLMAVVAAYVLYRSVVSMAHPVPTHSVSAVPGVSAALVTPVVSSVSVTPQVSAAPAPSVVSAVQESTRWRLVGVLTRADGSVYVAASNGVSFRRVPAADCDLPVGGDPSCKLDGELIAPWTGAVASPWSSGGSAVRATQSVLAPSPVPSAAVSAPLPMPAVAGAVSASVAQPITAPATR